MALETMILGNVVKPDLSLSGIAELTKTLQASNKVIEVPVKHRFIPGLYIREVYVPAGSGIVTMVHKTENPFVVSKGKVLVWTKEDGVVCIEAPFTGITKPGTCRLCLVLEDLIWTTFHPNPTNETDIEKIEKMLAWSPQEYAQLEEKENKCLSSQSE